MEFVLKRGQQCIIRIDNRESEAVKIAASNLAADLGRTLGISARVLQDYSGMDGKSDREWDKNEADAEILVGTSGVSDMISEKADLTVLCDDASGSLRKEAYLHRIVDGRLVIAGSDRRGTVYGIYELSEMLGVSPWHFWADVPVKKGTNSPCLRIIQRRIIRRWNTGGSLSMMRRSWRRGCRIT